MNGNALLGIDIGASGVKVAVLSAERGDASATVEAGGQPLDAVAAALGQLSERGALPATARLAVTGGGQDLLTGVVPCCRVNEVVAAAAGARAELEGARTVIDLGGQFSKWILLGTNGTESVSDFATNGLCAAGSGAFLEQQSSRLQVDVQELGRMAATADSGATIAGRCSVFAKSDMIHLQQKGTPPDEIAYGFCLAMVRTFLSTVVVGRELESPVALVGGGALNPGIVRAFRELLELGDGDLLLPDEPRLVCARGAAHECNGTEAVATDDLLAAIERAAGEARRDAQGLPTLPLLVRSEAALPVRDEVGGAAESGSTSAWLGIDVGSVSTNLVLFSRRGEVLQGVYLPTRGRPVEALAEGLAAIEERWGDRLDVLGVGTTGSGRHLAAELLGADAVHNEITAQAVSAAYFVPDVDTIFEIGGQDSKYISLRDGHLADFEMNKICSAGTGSFLEEQAVRLGVGILDGEFAEKALAAPAPPDLGTRCTVFMDAEMVRALEQGTPVGDVCAGLAYSVARNYLEKVVAGRPVGRRVLFQGGTASNAAVVAAFEQLRGEPVMVHPHNRVSGAIGAALLAARKWDAERFDTAFRGLDACSAAKVRSFECKLCDNRCKVNRIQVGDRFVHFGDACERFSARDRVAEALDRPFPDLFAAREALLQRHLARAIEPEEGTPIGLLRASLNAELMVLWAVLLRELGYRPVLSPRATPALLRDHASGAIPSEMCLPIKVAAAQADELLARGAVERVFVPSVIECFRDGDGRDEVACLYVQQLPDLLRVAHGERVVTARLGLEGTLLGRLEQAQVLATALRRPLDEVARALKEAIGAHDRFIAGRRALGQEALAAGFERAVVVMGKPYNVHDPYLNLSTAKHLEKAGLLAIPWDLLPLDDVELDDRWDSIPWHYNRQQLRAVQWMRRDPRLFPVLVSSFGCGPDGFVSRHLEDRLGGRPRLFLEFDEHQGEAGLVTRIEAFADEIGEHQRKAGNAPPVDRSIAKPRTAPRARKYYVPWFAKHAGIYAAVLEAGGFDAEIMPPPDAESIRWGEERSGGRECHPGTMLVGDAVRLAQMVPKSDEPVVFVSPRSDVPCLIHQYADLQRRAMDDLGRDDIITWGATASELSEIVGMRNAVRLYEGYTAADVLMALYWRLRPYVRDGRELELAYDRGFEAVCRAVAARTRVSPTLDTVVRAMMSLPRTGDPGERPVVGVTGDLYTRMNDVANARLFERLEELGCEVWPSPAIASLGEFSSAAVAPRLARSGRFRGALLEGFAWALMAGVRHGLVKPLSPRVRDLAVEPSPEALIPLADPYLSKDSLYLVMQIVSKVVDFLLRGADGVVSAIGLNCMVGTSAAAVFPSIRQDHGGAPILNLVYGGSEGPAQRIRLETFVHQVRERRVTRG